MVAAENLAWSEEEHQAPFATPVDLFKVLRGEVHGALLQTADLRELQNLSEFELYERIRSLTRETAQQRGLVLTGAMLERVQAEVLAELRGFGPIQPLLDDATVTEIMVNGPAHIFVERAGRLEATDISFADNAHLMRIIDKIISPLGRRLDEAMPMVDARLPDGSRVNAVIPPIALCGPALTIRKFSKVPLTPEDLVARGTWTEEIMLFLQACVRGRLNVIVSGGTGSGKTTTLNVLSSFIPSNERVVTIEDAAELQMRQDNVVALEARPPNLEGRGEIPIRQLVRNALRMRPDRIVVGEVRGAEALDMLQAMNTGHDGSLSTLHSNSPRDSLSRLETMVLMGGTELPSRAIREQVASAVDLIVHQARLRDGTRRITDVTEVQRMEGDTITLQDLYRFQARGVDAEGQVLGQHLCTGLRPQFLEKLLAQGIELPAGLREMWSASGPGYGGPTP
jgi:pilus assembly protein CpaF